jgi:hypothetical protein
MSLIRLIVFLMLILSLVGCSAPTHTTRQEAFNTDTLETTLKRGISTSSDIEAILGIPNGTGSLLTPIDKPRKVMFYEKFDVDTSHMKRAPGYVEIDVKQDVLLIFLKDGLYDGFLWFSDKVKPE